ncbi:hypothetical protein N7466_004670 [Penicillium verhagenii]|uniref:uncharacterized protein n=1 Tax=Penicillium verhagenii TaxID=1562060 RepID=UPI002545919A|nr:uncharacterized protein N7466_004670 [Penicillium verhagenii]KAJ5935123.1 hypothetical protein N7466_004670 [Penicillium verhagenii]
MCVYSEAQVEAYLQRIKYPTTSDPYEDFYRKLQTDPLATISELQRRHLCTIPWGNSGLHYSHHRTISLHPETLFEKIVERKLDGYCMESTGLFLHVLTSLGLFVYPTGGRVSRAVALGSNDSRYLPFNHMLLIVVIEGKKYLVDVGFGNNCAVAPLLLREGETAPHIGNDSEMRLIKDTLDEFVNKAQKVWIYQTRYNPTSDWVPNFCFSDVEFLPQDFEMMNVNVSTSRTSWFTQAVVCVLMIMDQSEENIIGQYVMLGKELKKRVHGESKILQVLQNEDDRVKALAKYFGISLRQNEIQGIQGLSSELK